MFLTNLSEKIKHTFYVLYISLKILAFMRMWNNRTRQVTDDNVIRHVHFACWSIKDTDTHWEYIICTVFHGDIGYTNATSCYLLHALPLCFCLCRLRFCDGTIPRQRSPTRFKNSIMGALSCLDLKRHRNRYQDNLRSHQSVLIYCIY